MANSQSTGYKPAERGRFFNKQPIFVGGETMSTGRRGLQDLAYVNNNIIGQHRSGISLHFPASNHLSAASITDAYYFRYYMPNTGGREVLRFEFDVTAAGTVDIYIETDADNDSTGAVASSSQTLDIAATPGQVNQIRIRATTSGGDANITNLRWHLKPLSGALAASVWDEDGWRPTNIPAADDPYDVDFVRDLISTYQHTIREFVMHPVLWSQDLTQSAHKARCYYGGQAIWQRVGEWLYFPSPGVKTLECYLNGFTDGFTGGDAGGDFRLYFDNRLDQAVSVNAAQASATWTKGNWLIEGDLLTVPNYTGPMALYLEARGDAGTSAAAFAQALSVIESRPVIA